MSGYVVVRDRYGRRTTSNASTWAKDYLRRLALADLGCAVVGVFAVVRLRFGNDVTGLCIALGFTLPVLWLMVKPGFFR
jgi:hypothetical protein